MGLQLFLNETSINAVSPEVNVGARGKSFFFDADVRFQGNINAGTVEFQTSKTAGLDDWSTFTSANNGDTLPKDVPIEGPYQRIRAITDGAFNGSITVLFEPAC